MTRLSRSYAALRRVEVEGVRSEVSRRPVFSSLGLFGLESASLWIDSTTLSPIGLQRAQVE
jgi:hypothetical protein